MGRIRNKEGNLKEVYIIFGMLTFFTLTSILIPSTSQDDFQRYIVYGNMAAKEGNYMKAIEYYKKARSIRFDDPIIYYNMALCYEKLEDIKMALDNYEQYLTLNPNAEDREEIQNKIYEFEYRLENLSQSDIRQPRLGNLNRPDLQPSAKQDSSQQYKQFGNQAAVDGNLSLAIDYYRKGLSLSRDDEELYFNLGICYEELGNLELAIENYRKYLQYAPNAQDTGSVENKIYELQYRLESPSPAIHTLSGVSELIGSYQSNEILKSETLKDQAPYDTYSREHKIPALNLMRSNENMVDGWYVRTCNINKMTNFVNEKDNIFYYYYLILRKVDGENWFEGEARSVCWEKNKGKPRLLPVAQPLKIKVWPMSSTSINGEKKIDKLIFTISGDATIEFEKVDSMPLNPPAGRGLDNLLK